MGSDIIKKLKIKINNEYKNVGFEKQKELSKEYNELTCREIINDYLYYGETITTFLNKKYECAKDFTRETIQKLFSEQKEYMENL